jgi:predicted RNA-binding protein associated with RNAse of E/G family
VTKRHINGGKSHGKSSVKIKMNAYLIAPTSQRKKGIKDIITEDGRIDPKILIENFDQITRQGGLETFISKDRKKACESNRVQIESPTATKQANLVEKGKNYMLLHYQQENSATHHWYLDVQVQNGGMEYSHMTHLVKILESYDDIEVQMSKVVKVGENSLRVVDEYVNGKELHNLAKLNVKKGDWLHVKTTGHSEYTVDEAHEVVNMLIEWMQYHKLM